MREQFWMDHSMRGSKDFTSLGHQSSATASMWAIPADASLACNLKWTILQLEVSDVKAPISTAAKRSSKAGTPKDGPVHRFPAWMAACFVVKFHNF